MGVLGVGPAAGARRGALVFTEGRGEPMRARVQFRDRTELELRSESSDQGNREDDREEERP